MSTRRCGCCRGPLQTHTHTHTRTACFPEQKTNHKNTALKEKEKKWKCGKIRKDFAILPVPHCSHESKEQFFLGLWELMYADLPLTDYDMKWLMGSSAVMCWLAQSPFLCLQGRRVLHSLIPRFAEHKCCAFKDLNAQMPMQFIFPCSSPESLMHFLSPMKVPYYTHGKHTSKLKKLVVL